MRPHRALAIATAATLLFAACGSDGGTEAATTTTSPQASVTDGSITDAVAGIDDTDPAPPSTTLAPGVSDDEPAEFVVFEGSTSHVQVQSGRLRPITIEFIAQGVSGTWTVETELSRGAGILEKDVPERFEIDEVSGTTRTLRVGATDEPEFIGTDQTIKLNVVPEDPANPSTTITVNIAVVGPDEPTAPAVTDDLVIEQENRDTVMFNPLFNDDGGTNGFDIETLRIEPIPGIQVGDDGNSIWSPSGENQSTSYVLCDDQELCTTGQIRFIARPWRSGRFTCLQGL